MRLSRGLWAAGSLLLVATLFVQAEGQVVRAQQAPARLRLAQNYDVRRVDTPQPELGGGFGRPLVNVGDVNRDGRDDLLASQQGQAAEGRAIVISGATGQAIHRLAAPDPSPEPLPAGNTRSQFGQYVGRLPDIGSCSGGQAGQTCPTNPIGAPDGIDELMVSGIKADVGPHIDIGRGYIFDGATGALLKRIDMPAADRAHQQLAMPGRRPENDPEFARTMLSPASPYPADAPQAVKIGDMDGGGRPDIIAGTGSYWESGPDSHPDCRPGPCGASGRAYFYRGEDIAGSNPNTPLETPYMVIKNPMPQYDDPDDPNNIGIPENFAHAIAPIGDVGKCNVNPGPGATCPARQSTITPDGRPDVIISGHRTDYPAGYFESGVVYTVDGSTGAILRRYEHPEPQPSVIWGFTLFNQPAIGDVAGSLLPDFYQPAVRQKVTRYAQGRGYFMNGDYKSSPNVTNLNVVDDPTPGTGAQFGTASAGIGDVADHPADRGIPHNEVMIGSWGAGANEEGINDVSVFSGLQGEPLLTIRAPDQQPGSTFGDGVAPLGDLNTDGLLDFAIAASGWDSPTTAGQGRIYIFTSRQGAASTAPGAVRGLRAVALSARSIRLTFPAVGSDGSNPPPATQYIVKQSTRPINSTRTFNRARSLCGGVCRFSPQSVGAQLTLNIGDLRPGTTYYYSVRARDNEGNLGPRSNTARARTRGR